MSFFDFVPILRGFYLTYQEYLALFSAFLYIAIGSLLQIIQYVKRRCEKNSNQSNNKKSDALLFWIGAYFQAFGGVQFSALNIVPMIIGMIISFSILKFNYVRRTWQLCPSSSKKENSHIKIIQRIWQNYQIQKKSNLKDFKKFIKYAILFSIIAPIVMMDTCLTFYHQDIGLQIVYGDLVISTGFFRKFELGAICPPGPPCHIYATIPEDSTHSAFINIHTHKSIESIDVFFDEQLYYNLTNVTRFQASVKTFKLKYIEKQGERNVHTALIDNLTPATKYIVKVFYQDDIQAYRVYQTPGDFDPNDQNTNLILVSGGDVGNNKAAMTLTSLLSQYSPSALFVGGDVTYDNNMHSCYYTWDFYLQTFERMTEKLGHLVPLVVGIGNHDVGLNALPRRKLVFDDMSPLFFHYFPEHFKQDKQGQIIREVPDLYERLSYSYHKFGRLVHFTLDSGYMVEMFGKQSIWINQVSQNNKDSLKMAIYHEPVYYSTPDHNKDKTPFQQKVFGWIPLFDENKFITVYENHVHTMKRTKPLRGSVEKVNGTVYLGDGSWGAKTVLVKESEYQEFFDTIKSINHVWITNITYNNVNHRAIGVHNEVIDSTDQNVSAYL